MLLSELNKRIGTRDKFLCISRPHRFGKTMAESMMTAYYSRGCNSTELFMNLKILSDSSFEKHLNKCNVLHLDIGAFWSENGDAVATTFNKAHEILTSPLSYNNEHSFQSAIKLAYLYSYLYYIIIPEYPNQPKAMLNLCFIPYKPNIPAMLIELRVKGALNTTLD